MKQLFETPKKPTFYHTTQGELSLIEKSDIENVFYSFANGSIEVTDNNGYFSIGHVLSELPYSMQGDKRVTDYIQQLFNNYIK
jgi:hypothetical protein